MLQGRAFDQVLSTYTGVPLSAGGDNDAAATPEARAQFDAGNGGILGFARSQINGILASPIGAWRVVSFIADVVRSKVNLFRFSSSLASTMRVPLAFEDQGFCTFLVDWCFCLLLHRYTAASCETKSAIMH